MPGFFLPKLRRYSCENVVFFCLNVSRDDGTAQLSVGELRQGKRNLFFVFVLSFPPVHRKILSQ